jgi:hypothetical protein
MQPLAFGIAPAPSGKAITTKGVSGI